MTREEMLAMEGANQIDVSLMPVESRPRYLIDE
jgi:hypothetical protein